LAAEGLHRARARERRGRRAGAAVARGVRGLLPGAGRLLRGRERAPDLGARPLLAHRREPRRALCLRERRPWRGARARPHQRPLGVEAGPADAAPALAAAAGGQRRGGRRLRGPGALPLARERRLRQPLRDERRRGARGARGASRRRSAHPDAERRPVCACVVKPVIALVGRPNVGKSTLFNRLTRSRDAIVHDVPGVTRDRHYGEGRAGGRAFIAIDTGGFEPAAKKGDVLAEMARQAEQAIAEADAVVFVVDARAGLAPTDRLIAEKLRKVRAPLTIAANKSEGLQRDTAAAEFHELGLGDPVAISAAHGEGVRELFEAILERFPEGPEDEDKDCGHPRVSIVGRPNVGKSTLVNALVGEERVIAFDKPGTTRDPIEVPFERAGRRYTLIDTAGLRRRGKTGEPVEYFSIVKALQSIEASNVSVLVLDASTGVTEQDAHVAGYILERGRAVVIAVNKWDA